MLEYKIIGIETYLIFFKRTLVLFLQFASQFFTFGSVALGLVQKTLLREISESDFVITFTLKVTESNKSLHVCMTLY